MKIIQIVTQMEAGGAQRMAHLLGRELVEGGHEVELWFLYQKRPAYAGMPGVRVVLDHPPRGLDYFVIIARLAAMLRSARPDAIITHTHYANVIGQFVGKLCGIKRGIAVQHAPFDSYPVVGRCLDRILGTAGFYDVNVAVSDAVVASASSYPSKYRRGLSKIYNGIPKPTPSGLPEAIRERWQLPPASVPLLAHVGRMSKQKNQLFLLDVVSLLPEVHLVLVGDGEMRQEVVDQIQRKGLRERVHYMGEVSAETTHDLVSASDVFVFPSRFEAMSMILLEAMHLSIPIVASDIPGNCDLLQTSAVLLGTEDPEPWAREIRLLLNCKESAARIAREEYVHVQKFTAAAMALSYSQLLM
jgi:glycosyltransferase involved in cell wall biosynthesis